MYNFFFPFLFSSSSPVISFSLLVFLYLSASSFAAAAKASPSSSPTLLLLFFLHTQLQPNKPATMPSTRRDQNANTNASNLKSRATIQVPSTMTTLSLSRCQYPKATHQSSEPLQGQLLWPQLLQECSPARS